MSQSLSATIITVDGLETVCHVRAPHPGHDVDLFRLIAARLQDDGHDLTHRDILWGNILTEAEAGTLIAFEAMPYYDFTDNGECTLCS